MQSLLSMQPSFQQVDHYTLLAYARAELKLLRAETRDERLVRLPSQEDRAKAIPQAQASG
jgi:hypothetical protein